MGKRKRPYRPKGFESTGKPNDTSANIYNSMLLSPAFLDLTKNQRLLYVCMKDQYYGKRKPGKDYPDIEQLQGDDLFYFNCKTAELYGICTRANHGQLYRDIKALEEHGFIETVSSGKNARKKSIYRYSEKWKSWNDSS